VSWQERVNLAASMCVLWFAAVLAFGLLCEVPRDAAAAWADWQRTRRSRRNLRILQDKIDAKQRREAGKPQFVNVKSLIDP